MINTTKSYTYPRTASVDDVTLETDPTNFVTHPMSSLIIDIGDRLRRILCQNKSILDLEGINLDKKFNHMTLLAYYSSSVSDRKS